MKNFIQMGRGLLLFLGITASQFRQIGAIRLRGALTSLVLCIALYTPAHAAVETYVWHQKLTVEVETPTGLKAGSSVVEVTSSFYSGWHAMGSGGKTDIRGEAVVVEVAPGKYLFALLRGMPSAYSVFFPEDRPEDIANKMKALRARKVLLPAQYPTFVTFADLRKPTSVRQVDAASIASVFGQGFDLKQVSLELTSAPLDVSVLDSLLPWLGRFPEPKLGPPTGVMSDIPLYRHLAQGDFIRR